MILLVSFELDKPLSLKASTVEARLEPGFMKKSYKEKISKNIPLIIKIVGGMICAAVAFLTIAYVIFVRPIIFENQIQEARVRKEITKTSGVRIVSYQHREMGNVIKAEIVNKGSVVFQYWEDGRYGVNPLIQIDKIGPYKTSFLCVTVGSDRTLNQEAREGIFFGKSSYFLKWFPFEVNNIKDLVTHYDTIIDTLKTFPNVPSMRVIYDEKQWKKEKFIVELNPNYVSHINRGTYDIYCDISIPKE